MSEFRGNNARSYMIKPFDVWRHVVNTITVNPTITNYPPNLDNVVNGKDNPDDDPLNVKVSMTYYLGCSGEVIRCVKKMSSACRYYISSKELTK
ncbi:hypothetical protein PsorP6_001391 [Peronosclerospora sorghi]|uniref:Uncharacterized protein n=1 Tax=Peronosclerospora sorghi TaxID=230839 RepID=A0ACC0WX36_9STRA|nr:hypothetical protein PsorP6_001391 [Peronosclerospora sorghi]